MSAVELTGLRQPPISTTLMGCIKGAADYWNLKLSLPMLFGLTGHAFLINIHDELCPSGPYVWNTDRFYTLLREQGIGKVEICSISRESSTVERLAFDKKVKDYIESDSLCILNYLENQLISGYDDHGFVALQPWGGKAPSEIPRISYGTWEECLEDEGWAGITVISKQTPTRALHETAKAALRYGAELFRDGSKYENTRYHIGRLGYETWIDTLKAGSGSSHGHWWNAIVWAECRAQGANYFRELGELSDDPAAQTMCDALAVSFESIAEHLTKVQDREMHADNQAACLEAAVRTEGEAVALMEELSAAL